MDFQEHLKSYLSNKEIEELSNSLLEENKHAVLLNPRKMSDETFLSLFPHVSKHPIVKHAYIYDKKEYELGKSIYHALGCFYLQEPSAMIPAYLLKADENDIVLDMCAAPGGKSIQTAFLMNNAGLIISNDLSRSRVSAIVENVERLGIGNIVITSNDLSTISNKYLNSFDKIILDAPCSGSGMFRKDDKMIKDWSYNKVIKFAETQKQLISIAYNMLKPGGTICYSTCSFSKEEDEDVIKYLLDNSDAELLPIEDNTLFYVNKKESYGVHLFPNRFPGEGHYICLIKKPGISSNKNTKTTVYNNKFNLPFNFIDKYGDFLFGSNTDFNLKYFNIVRKGVKIGELIKDEIKYDYHYAHYVDTFKLIHQLNEDELKHYMLGETLPANLEKGYYLLTYKDINVDIAKCDGRLMKNHLPKGLRNKF